MSILMIAVVGAIGTVGLGILAVKTEQKSQGYFVLGVWALLFSMTLYIKGVAWPLIGVLAIVSVPLARVVLKGTLDYVPAAFKLCVGFGASVLKKVFRRKRVEAAEPPEAASA